MFEIPNHAQLLEKVGLRQMVSDVIDELIELANAQGCSFPDNFRQKTIENMTASSDPPSTMYQDFLARRPMEVETYLGSPIKLATETDIRIPRIETLYAMLHHVNILNQTRPQKNDSPPPVLAQPPPRMSSAPGYGQRPPMNGAMRGGRAPSMGMMPPPSRRGPPPMGGPRTPNGQPPAGRLPRDPSFEDSGLEEFSHLVLYDDGPDAAIPQNGGPYPDAPSGSASAADLALRERELALRQRELQLREQEMSLRRNGGGGRRGPPPRPATFDEEDEDDYVDPLDPRIPVPQIDPDNFDMMSVTSRRTRKAPSASQLRKNPEITANSRPGSSFSRYFGGSKNRTSARIMQDMPGVHENLLDNPMMMYSSNRYGAVDRKEMHVESRANSMTASRAGDYGPGPYPPSRRTSQSPGTPFGGMGGRGMPRPPPPHDYPSYGPPNGMPQGGRPSPPGGMPAPVPRYPPGQGNAVGPQQVEQNLGVSNSYPAKGSPNNRSLTGSASASAESGDSGASANIDSENSAHSSQTSFGGQQAPMPVR